MKIFNKHRRQDRKEKRQAKKKNFAQDPAPVLTGLEKRRARQQEKKNLNLFSSIKLNATITDKQKNMNFLKPAGKIALSILKGFADAFFPNIKNTIKMSESEFKDDKTKKWEIDFPRLLAAVTVWIILLLVFFGKVKFEDVIDIIGRLL